MHKLKKIVVIGPESTGKSTLCYQLAEHFKSLWAPEFARQYLEKKPGSYQYDDLLTIAKGQLRLEDEYVINSVGQSFLFIDTDMHVMQVWSEFAFGKCDNWILQQIAGRQYDLYMLCNTDLPWILDELREYPDAATRNKLYRYYKEQMLNQGTPWIDISGNYEHRLQLAIDAVEKMLY
ncbi:MAG: AAA family ATPase [Ginsengibacter sp.]